MPEKNPDREKKSQFSHEKKSENFSEFFSAKIKISKFFRPVSLFSFLEFLKILNGFLTGHAANRPDREKVKFSDFFGAREEKF